MVTVKWPEPSHHPTDKVTYYWLQSCCRDASKHGGKCFQPLPPATALSQQWDVNSTVVEAVGPLPVCVSV